MISLNSFGFEKKKATVFLISLQLNVTPEWGKLYKKSEDLRLCHEGRICISLLLNEKKKPSVMSNLQERRALSNPQTVGSISMLHTQNVLLSSPPLPNLSCEVINLSM